MMEGESKENFKKKKWELEKKTKIESWNFGSALVHSMVVIYLPNCTNVYGWKSGEFEGTG